MRSIGFGFFGHKKIKGNAQSVSQGKRRNELQTQKDQKKFPLWEKVKPKKILQGLWRAYHENADQTQTKESTTKSCKRNLSGHLKITLTLISFH